MEPRDLANQKASPKRLQDAPSFKLLKRGKLPKPFHKTGGPRTFATDVIEVSTEHVVVFIWRDGEILTDRAFFGHLLCKLPTGALYPGRPSWLSKLPQRSTPGTKLTGCG